MRAIQWHFDAPNPDNELKKGASIVSNLAAARSIEDVIPLDCA